MKTCRGMPHTAIPVCGHRVEAVTERGNIPVELNGVKPEFSSMESYRSARGLQTCGGHPISVRFHEMTRSWHQYFSDKREHFCLCIKSDKYLRHGEVNITKKCSQGHIKIF